jgi:hypothetical protein
VLQLARMGRIVVAGWCAVGLSWASVGLALPAGASPGTAAGPPKAVTVTVPTITAVGATTPLTAAPGSAATAKFKVTIPAGWPLDSGFLVYFSETSLWTASTVALSTSITGCPPVALSPSSASNALGCVLPIAAGTSKAFTFTAPLPITGGYQDTLSAELVQVVVPNSQLGYQYYGPVGVTFNYGIAPSTTPGVTAFIAPITPGTFGNSPPPPVVATGNPWTAEVVASAYNATVSPLTVVVQGPAGITVAPDPSIGANPAGGFACTPVTSTSISCTGGSVPGGGEAAWRLSGAAPPTAATVPLSVVVDPGGTAPSGVAGAPATSSSSFTASATLPDLALAITRPATVYVATPFTEAYQITNVGYSPAAAPALTVLTPEYASSASSSSMSCSDTQVGHSGRGGGYTHTGYLCSGAPGSTLAPGASLTVVARFALTTTATVNQSITASTTSVQQGNATHRAGDVIVPQVPPAPSAPTGVMVSQNVGSLVVAFAPGTPPVPGVAVTSTATATPTGGGTALSGAVVTTSGSPTTIILPGVSGSTAYSVAVSAADPGGSTAATPVLFTTASSSVPPGAPTISWVRWNTYGEFIAAWSAAPPGDSATTDYQVLVTNPDTGKSFTVDAGNTLEAAVYTNPTPDYRVQVRAANGAGWGPWSASVLLGGL